MSSPAIRFEYAPPSPSLLQCMRDGSAAVEFKPNERISIENFYFKQNIPGTLGKIYLRKILIDKIQVAVEKLDPKYGFIIFDGFRSKETQGALFNTYYQDIARAHPDWSEEKLQSETRNFIAHPDEPGRFNVPPHNSGGAVDLTLSIDGKPADMGTAFDDLTTKASTDYFEKDFNLTVGVSEVNFMQIRENRRVLFHAMKEAAFTNWPHEWWHYDLGDALWSRQFNLPEFFDAMAPLIAAI